MLESSPYEDWVSKVNELQAKGDAHGLIDILELSQPKKELKKLFHLALDGLSETKAAKATEALISRGLVSKMPVIRDAAVRALGNIGNEAAVEALIYQTLKGEGGRSENAAEALGKLKSKKAVKPLILLLADTWEDWKQDQKGVKTVVWALGEIGSQEAVEPLIQFLESDGADGSAKEEAVRALGKLGTEKAIETIVGILRKELAKPEAVVQTMEEGKWTLTGTELAETASVVLKEIGTGAVQPLISALNDDDEMMRCKATKILGDIGDSEAVGPLMQSMKGSWSHGIAAHAVVSIGLANKMIEPLVDVLEANGYDLIEDANIEVVEAMAKIGGDKAIDILVNLASQPETNGGVTYHAVDALGVMGRAAALGNRRHDVAKALIKILLEKGEKYCRKRGYAARSLGNVGDNIAIEPLIRVLENPREHGPSWLKDNVAWALSHFDDDRIELPLLKYFKTAIDSSIGSNSVEAEYSHESKDTRIELETLEAIGKLVTRLLNNRRVGG